MNDRPNGRQAQWTIDRIQKYLKFIIMTKIEYYVYILHFVNYEVSKSKKLFCTGPEGQKFK